MLFQNVIEIQQKTHTHNLVQVATERSLWDFCGKAIHYSHNDSIVLVHNSQSYGHGVVFVITVSNLTMLGPYLCNILSNDFYQTGE